MSLGPVMIGLSGIELLPEEKELLQHPLVGGVILFTRNYESPQQIKQLTKCIHDLRQPRLLIAVDHEGGRVQRFRQEFTHLPPVRTLGDVYDEDPHKANMLSEVSGWLMAIELRSVGIDFSFAPVLDLDRKISSVIGDRAFHSDPEIVSELAYQYSKGMKRAGMAATGKHFPGHGSVKEDSHLELPIDDRQLADMVFEDMLPFERMIGHGMEAVMVAHVVYENIDPDPAGFSSYWMKDILRKRLGFQGLIFSDDLEMEGAAIAGDMKARAIKALQAGCDMILVCQKFEAMTQAVDGIGEWTSPASQLRLTRMHGKNTVEWDNLHNSANWKEAVKLINSYSAPHTMDLI